MKDAALFIGKTAVLVLRTQRRQTLEDVDGIGQLVILLPPRSRGFGLLAVFLDLADLVFGQAVVGQATAQVGLGPGAAVGGLFLELEPNLNLLLLGWLYSCSP